MTRWQWSSCEINSGVSCIYSIVIQVNAPTSNAKEAKVEWFFEDLQDLLELTREKDILSIIGDWNAKVRRNTWSNGQIWPWSTEWNRAKASKILPREHTDHRKQPLPIAQEKTGTSPDSQHRNQTDYIFCSQRWRSSIQSAKIRRSWLWLRSWTPYCQIQTEIEDSRDKH